MKILSSPKGLRAESARAVTGGRCPHSEVGEDFLVRRPGPLMKAGVTLERKVFYTGVLQCFPIIDNNCFC